MTGKELLIQTLKHHKTEQLPWVPLIGVHAGKLKGYSAEEVLTDEDKLFESLMAVNQVYTPDGMPIYFDIQFEAEILGCELFWSHNSPPSVNSHPLSEHNQIPEKIPIPEEGRLGLTLRVMRRVKDEIGDQVGLFGLVTGPLTIAYHLRGRQIFLDVLRDPGYLNDLLMYTSRVTQAISTYFIEAGMDLIGVIEPVTSLISPDTFSTVLLDKYREIFTHIRDLDAYSMLHICGRAGHIVDLVCQSGTDVFSFDENVDLGAIKPITDQHQVVLQGNLPIASHLLPGTPQENTDYLLNMLTSLPNHQNLIISPGCDMPYDTPIENVTAVIKAIREFDAIR